MMAVEITLAVPKLSYSSDIRSLKLSDDGYYWYLYPIFETLYSRTSQMIDLYGDAEFDQDHLQELKQALSIARTLVLQQPDNWLVYSGGVYSEVQKTTFLSLIEQIEAMAEYAIREGGVIVCLGD
jgi:hypothetical protein